MGMHSRVAIVLTATVDPDRNTPNLVIRNPNERFTAYLMSIKWWSQVAAKSKYDLFIFENSDSAKRFSPLESDVVSVISIEAQDPRSVLKGKGAGESKILFEAAEIVKDYSLALKCTGRLRVLNATEIIERHLAQPEVESMISWDSSLNKVDTRCFTVRPRFLRAWMGAICEQASDDVGCDLESQSARWLMRQILDGQQIRDFARTPAIVGRSASEGVSYSEYKARARSIVEKAVRGRLRTDQR